MTMKKHNPLKKLFIPGSERKDTRTIALTKREAYLLWRMTISKHFPGEGKLKGLLYQLLSRDEHVRMNKAYGPF